MARAGAALCAIGRIVAFTTNRVDELNMNHHQAFALIQIVVAISAHRFGHDTTTMIWDALRNGAVTRYRVETIETIVPGSPAVTVAVADSWPASALTIPVPSPGLAVA